MKIDLHTHSNHSSCGDQTVKELLDAAKDFGISIVSLTDHDSVAGVEEAISYGAEIGVTVVPGIEISASTKEDVASIPLNSRVHVLGYNIDYKNKLLQEKYDALLPTKKRRAEQVIEHLKTKGYFLCLDELPEYNELHIIRQLIKKGYCEDRKAAKKIVRTEEIYTKYPEVRFTLKESVDLILELGGLPVLAHAYRGANKVAYSDGQVLNLIRVMRGYGLVGVETHHYFHVENNRIGKLLNICKEYGLIPSIGSDHHSCKRVYDGISDYYLRTLVFNSTDIEFTEILKALKLV